MKNYIHTSIIAIFFVFGIVAIPAVIVHAYDDYGTYSYDDSYYSDDYGTYSYDDSYYSDDYGTYSYDDSYYSDDYYVYDGSDSSDYYVYEDTYYTDDYYVYDDGYYVDDYYTYEDTYYSDDYYSYGDSYSVGYYDGNYSFGYDNGYDTSYYLSYNSTNSNSNNNNGSCTSCGNNDPVLTGSCAAYPSNPETGETVTWDASASGGSGSYSYSWSGTNGLSGSGDNVYKSYSSEGTKNATVVITSGGESITRSCSVFVEDDNYNNDDLEVYCTPNNDDYEVDERVTWEAHVSGGDGDYDYDWDGTDGLNGNSRTESVRYDDDGRKYAYITVRSDDGQTASDSCYIDVEDDDNDLDVTCRVSDTRIDEGDRITFEADIDGGNGPYDIQWDGDIDDIDDFDDEDRYQTVRIDDDGTYYIEVEVEDDDGNRASDDCSVIYVGRDRNSGGVTITSNTNPTGQVLGVSLAQVPYTGLGDMKFLDILMYVLGGGILIVILGISLFIFNKRREV